MRIFFFFLLTHQFVHAQVQISGFIFNLTTGTAIEHATIELSGIKTYRTFSDSSGAFIFRSISPEEYTLKITHVSYHTVEKVLTVQKDTVLHLYLEHANDSLYEVLVTAHHIKPISANILLDQDEILQKGSVLGEANIYEALQRQAGIIHTHEFNTGLYVRGLGSGNTGIFIDGTNTFSGNHLLGIYPVINANAYANVKLLKEDIHPQYSGYLSSYLLLETENHISDSIQGDAELGILTTKLGISLPMVKKKIGLTSNIRRSYFDIISNTYNRINQDNKDYSPLPTYSFYDWNNTLLINQGKRGLIKVNTFYSSDQLLMNNDNFTIDADWKNWSISAHWQYFVNKNTQLKINLGHSGYRADFDNLTLMSQMKNRISESSMQANLNWQVSNQFSLDYGLYAKNSVLSMNSASQFEPEASNGNIAIHKKRAQNIGGYIFSNISPEKTLSVKLGFKLEHYRSDKQFVTFSPTLNVLFNKLKQSIFFDISRRVQFSHLFVPLGVQLPMNIWYPSTRQAPPENAWHITTTYSRQFSNQLKGSLSAYYILLNNQIEFLDKNYFSSLDVTTTIGQGVSKGVELNLFFNKKYIQVESHYTLGKSTCQFPDINNGKEFSLPYDIRHKIDLSFSWRLHRNWLLSFSQFIQSGFLITIPTGLYMNQGADGGGVEMHDVPIYKDRNNFRMPLSHRMDISIKHKFLIKKLKCSWSAGTFNTYGYKNPYFIYFSILKNELNQMYLQAKKKSILPLVPFFSIHTEF
jgi:hypothetical protein